MLWLRVLWGKDIMFMRLLIWQRDPDPWNRRATGTSEERKRRAYAPAHGQCEPDLHLYTTSNDSSNSGLRDQKRGLREGAWQGREICEGLSSDGLTGWPCSSLESSTASSHSLFCRLVCLWRQTIRVWAVIIWVMGYMPYWSVTLLSALLCGRCELEGVDAELEESADAPPRAKLSPRIEKKIEYVTKVHAVAHPHCECLAYALLSQTSEGKSLGHSS